MDALRHAVESGRARPSVQPWLVPAGSDAPPDVAGVLAFGPGGGCVFHAPKESRPAFSTAVSTANGAPADDQRGGCLVHALRPSSCVHFPFVCVSDPRGVHVTLSHYCPTAAALLFDADGPPRKVSGPPVPVGTVEPEGLDAREALPPVRVSRESAGESESRREVEGQDKDRDWDRDQQGEATVFRATGRRSSASVLPRLMSWDEVTRWEARAIDEVAASAGDIVPPDMALFGDARAAVADSLHWPAAPADCLDAWHTLVAPDWPRWRTPIGHYLASKVHAAWALYLGDGTGAVVRQVRMAATVLAVEAVRVCQQADAPLDGQRLLAAIRRADLLLVHYADPSRLVRI